jgi:hypothetical protein
MPRKANLVAPHKPWLLVEEGARYVQDIPPWFICVWNTLKQLFLSDYICAFIESEILFKIIKQPLSTSMMEFACGLPCMPSPAR